MGVRRAERDHGRVAVRRARHRLDNRSEFINDQLLRYCQTNKITSTRSRPGNKNDAAHVEEKNWSVVRQAVGYHRYDTEQELLLLNEIYALLRLQINFFSPHQKLVSKVRDGAKVTKRHDTARTAYQRVLAAKPSRTRSKTSSPAKTDRLTPPSSAVTSPSACRRRRHSHQSCSDDLGFVVVMHPFHPLRGRRLAVLFVKRCGTDVVFVCARAVGGR